MGHATSGAVGAQGSGCSPARTTPRVEAGLTAFAQDGLSVSIEDAADAVARTMTSVVGVNRCAVFLKTDDYAFTVQTWLGSRKYTEHLAGMVNGEDPYTSEILSSRRPVVVADSLTDARVAQHIEVTRRCDVHSMLGVPLIVEDAVVGLAFLDDEGAAAAFTADQIARAVSFSNLCGITMQQTKAHVQSRAAAVAWEREAIQTRHLLTATDYLDQLVRDGASATEFAVAAAAVVGRPVEILDARWKVVAHAQPKRAPHRRVGQLSDARVRTNARILPLLTRASHEGQPCVLPPLPALGVDLRVLVTPILMAQGTWGHLAIHESGRPFSDFDHRVASSVANRVGLSSVASRPLPKPRQRSDRDAVLRRALQGNMPSASAKDEAMPSSPYVLGVFGGIGLSTVPQSARDLVQLLALEALDGVSVSQVEHQGRLVVLMPSPDGPDEIVSRISSVVDRAVGLTPEFSRLSLAVSQPFSDLSRTPHALEEALQVLRAVGRFENPQLPRVVSATELGACLTFLSSADVSEARHFALAYAGPLLGEDAPADLFATLRAFLREGSAVRCARALGVHENTVRYRLTKIEALTGLDLLGDTEAQVRAALAVQVLRMTGDCAW